MRIKIVRFTIIVLFIIIVGSLFYVQAMRGKFYYNLSMNNSIRVVHLEGFRGRIFDRNQRILADNRTSYNVTIIPQDIKEADQLFSFLSKVLSIEKKDLIRGFHKKKVTPFTPVMVAEDITKDQAIILEENKYLFPSLYVQESFKRMYPFNKFSAHVVGYVGKINRVKAERYREYGYSPQSLIGYSGVEEFYDSYLKGEEGGYQIEINSKGEQVRLLSLKNPLKGQDIVLSIDAELQEISWGLLEGRRGAIILMDSDNGEILGLVSSPSFDPNIFVDSSKQKRMSSLFSNPDAPLLNRAVKGLYPPGSVFKIPVAIAALYNQKITSQTTFNCEGYYQLADIKFKCTHKHGSQNLIEAIAHSCNVYFYHLGLNLGAEMIRQGAEMLGLGSPTYIDLPYEASGYVPSRRQGVLSSNRRWYTGDTLNFSIGQGDLLSTPLQLVKMMATVANEGIEVQPHLIKSIGGMDVKKYSFQKSIPIKKSVFEEVQKGMRAAVEEFSGTAHVLDIKDIFVAGKTGTAQAHQDKENHAWFVGYVKGKKNLAFCVFLEHGGSSQNACLVARQLLIKMKNMGVL